MGRLFWKFFAAILLAQVAATIGVSTVFWLHAQSREREARSGLDVSHPATEHIEAAAATLEFGGPEALRKLLERMPPQGQVLAVDENGHDLLGRTVDAALLARAEYTAGDAQPRSGAKRVPASDGHRYLLFLPARRLHTPFEPFGPTGHRPRDTATAGPQRHPRLSAGAERIGDQGSAAVERPPAPSTVNDSRNATASPPAGTLAATMAPLPGGPDTAAAQETRAHDQVRTEPAGGHGAEGPPPPGGPDAAGTPPPGMPHGPEFAGLPRHFLPMMAALFASLIVAAALAWYFSRPIRELRAAFDAAAAGNLEPRFARTNSLAGDELRALGRDFDRMTSQLRTLMDGQRRLLHDVSHELRSPLARLQAAIGIAHQQPDKIAPSLERIERESVRMDKLVGELLTLSRLEVSTAPPQKEDIPFMDLIDGIAEDCGFEAEQAGRQLAVSGSAVLTIHGSPDLLWRAIENVVRNAIKHSPAGGVVDLDLHAELEKVRLTVLDRGPGIRDEDLNAVFQPFFRSQPDANNVDGHGLGLAIAQRVVHAHGGTITARNRDGGGLAVDITLPVKSASA